MTNHSILEPLAEDQWFIQSQELRSLVETVHEISASTVGDRTQTITRLEPYFQELLAQQQSGVTSISQNLTVSNLSALDIPMLPAKRRK